MILLENTNTSTLDFIITFCIFFISGVIKQHCMQKPIKVARCHLFKNKPKCTNPSIQLFTCLIIECSLIKDMTLAIGLSSHQIWCRPIQWGRITLLATKIIISTMINIMITVHNRLSCFFPYLFPTSICDSSTQHYTSERVGSWVRVQIF
jgi:hypothetical protein